MALNFNFPFCFRVPTRGAGYLRGAPEKPLLVHGDDLLYLPDGAAKPFLMNKPRGLPTGQQ